VRESSAAESAAIARRLAAGGLAPMLAVADTTVPAGPGWAVELKYDGIRVLALATADTAALVTRNGMDKASQFPEVAAAAAALARSRGRPLILDGEIVPLVRHGGVGRFQALQHRIHAREPESIARAARETPATLVAFDLLLDGTDEWLTAPWHERRDALRRIVARSATPHLQLAEALVGDPAPLLARARREGWEGLVAKRVDAPYVPGLRSPAWRKIKLTRRQELVIGGFTAPRGSRAHLGAILVGVYEGRGASRRLVYAGRVGSGFSRAALATLREALRPLERDSSPFAASPAATRATRGRRADAAERITWVEPVLVAEVEFNEWTTEGVLRQPVYLGLRDDKPAASVRREQVARAGPPEAARLRRRRVPSRERTP
jgi:bifunctional non-homologous end joining protein LigD